MLRKPSSILENKPNPQWATGNLTREANNLITHQKSQERAKKTTIKLISVLEKSTGTGQTRTFHCHFNSSHFSQVLL